MRSLLKPVSIFAACIFVGIACRKKDYACVGCGAGNGGGSVAVNKAPVAIAGTDRLITLPVDSVLLDGIASYDPDGTIAGFRWAKISGPGSYTIANATNVKSIINQLTAGTYQFELTVTDNGGLVGKDTTRVIVETAANGNHAPFAFAGNDTTIQFNHNSCAGNSISINLNGTGSNDPDGSITSYLWTSSTTISSANSAITSASNLFPGLNTFVLKVTDNSGAISLDTLTVTVVLNNRPVVAARLVPFATLSQARGAVTMGRVGNKVLFAGGNGFIPCAYSRVDLFDIVTNIWTTAELSQPRYVMGVATLGNKIFFAGGYKPEEVYPGGNCYISNWTNTRSSVVDIYDASTNSWTTAQLSVPRVPKAASAGNKVVFAGGDCLGTSVVPSDRVDIFDAGSNTWSTKTLNEVKGLPQVAASSDNIYFAGGASIFDGDNWGPITKRIDIYNTSSGSWTVDSLSRGRGEMASITANNKVYWAGGYVDEYAYTGYFSTSLVEIRDLNTNITSFDCLSQPAASITAVRKGNKLVFFKGYSDRFDIYDLSTQMWSIGLLSQQLQDASIISVNDVLYVVGSTTSAISNQVWKLEF